MRTLLLAVLLAPVAIYAGMALVWGREGALEKIWGPVRREPVDFETLELKPSPNQYLVCPPDFCAAQAHEQSPVFEVPAEELRNRWMRMTEGLGRVALLSRDDERLQYDFEARTPVILFPDTVTVRFIPLDERRSTLAVYSRSHYGYSDLGENRRRVQKWLRMLREAG